MALILIAYALYAVCGCVGLILLLVVRPRVRTCRTEELAMAALCWPFVLVCLIVLGCVVSVWRWTRRGSRRAPSARVSYLYRDSSAPHEPDTGNSITAQDALADLRSRRSRPRQRS